MLLTVDTRTGTLTEDPDAAVNFITASIWAAIRERHGGVLRTPFGVLVAERSMVEDVLLDPKGNVSVRGYLPRMHASFGEIFLGLEPGGTAVLNRDNTCFAQLAERARAAGVENIIAFGSHPEADVRLVNHAQHASCSCITADICGQAEGRAFAQREQFPRTHESASTTG